MFTACQGVKTTYTLSGDSHMMKNIEWGAVAYLAESKYGRNGTQITSNLSEYSTGGGNYVTNVLQSTTGNIYGIYDMSAGAVDSVAGYIDNNSASSNGNITNLINAVKENSKYADVYKVTTDNQTTNYTNAKGMKGDALYETSTGCSYTSSWHGGAVIFPSGGNTVIGRGRLSP